MKFRWYITKRHLVILIGILTAIVFGFLLTGCTTTSERSHSNSSRTQITERHPTPDGGYVEKVTEYTEGERTKDITTKADIDWNATVIKAGAAAATGDWGALGGIAGTMLAAGGIGYLQHRRTRELKADSDEGWAKYEAAIKERSAVREHSKESRGT